MLGDSDPDIRDGIAFPTLGTWIDEGVYDDLLRGLGDGMCAGLDVGLGEESGDSVFRRSFSALVLTECIDRDTVADLADPRPGAPLGRPDRRLAAARARPARLRARPRLGARASPTGPTPSAR